MAEWSLLNQEYFDNLASEYDSRFGDTLLQLEQAIRDAKDFIGMKAGGKVLDYACGTGLLSRALKDQAGQCIGIDVSENMVGAYNARARSENLYPDKRVAHFGNLVLPDDPASEAFSSDKFQSFDLASVTVGFHHFTDCDLAAQRLGERLAPGGVLFILDFLPHGEDASTKAGVMHHGFSEARIKEIFEKAGCAHDYGLQKAKEEIVFMDKKSERRMVRDVFLARGTKK